MLMVHSHYFYVNFRVFGEPVKLGKDGTEGGIILFVIAKGIYVISYHRSHAGQLFGKVAHGVGSSFRRASVAHTHLKFVQPSKPYAADIAVREHAALCRVVFVLGIVVGHWIEAVVGAVAIAFTPRL
jgi:hypothetical protein